MQAALAGQRPRFLHLVITAALAAPFGAVHDASANTFEVRSNRDLDDSFLPDMICDTQNNPLTNPPTPPSGECTLRAAIEQANNTPGGRHEIIIYSQTAGYIISLTSPLPPVTHPIWIHGTGTTRPIIEGTSAGGDGLVFQIGGNIVQFLSIVGFDGAAIRFSGSGGNKVISNYIGFDPTNANLPGNGEGIAMDQSIGNTIGGNLPALRNVISHNDGDGIHVTGGSGHSIIGNYIGTDENGRTGLLNAGVGIVLDHANYTTIGGATADLRNLISSNTLGGVSLVGANRNSIFGNYIGTDLAGGAALPNGFVGVRLKDSPDNYVGSAPGTTGTAPAPSTFTPASGGPPGNLISGNDGPGISLEEAGTVNNHIEGNFIGTDKTGKFELGNAWDGISISVAPKNLIGKASAGGGNLIAGNHKAGIRIDDAVSAGNSIVNNWIGTDISGIRALPNRSLGIYITKAPGTLIGGPTAAERNVISGNGVGGPIPAFASKATPRPAIRSEATSSAWT